MEQFYFDTSAILPYNREELYSKVIQKVMLSITPPVAISHLAAW